MIKKTFFLLLLLPFLLTPKEFIGFDFYESKTKSLSLNTRIGYRFANFGITTNFNQLNGSLSLEGSFSDYETTNIGIEGSFGIIIPKVGVKFWLSESRSSLFLLFHYIKLLVQVQ
jgi:hypothetical protein